MPRYRFRSVWHVDAPAARVWDLLEAVPEYPAWWPQIRQARMVELSAVEVVARSMLPYELRMVLRPTRREDGVLEVRLSGDLDGFARFTLSGSTTVVFEQEVELRKLRWLSPVAAPFFRANHWWMMRGGERGLSRAAASPPR